MSIKTVTDTETRLTNTLRTTTEALTLVTAERDQLLANSQTDEMLITAAQESAARAIAERDALRADAERYRWLRCNPEWLGWEHDFSPDEVEREINAAMKGTS